MLRLTVSVAFAYIHAVHNVDWHIVLSVQKLSLK